MNIAIGKFGRSIYFDKSRWGIIGGDETPPIFYTKLAKTYPQPEAINIPEPNTAYMCEMFKKYGNYRNRK